MRILLTGRRGQLGSELEQILPSLGEVIATDRNTLDLSDPDVIRSVVREAKPHLVVNAGAYTAVDLAESEPDLAMRINGVAPGILAEEAKKLSAFLIHFSTDYVFDGCKASPYIESDDVNPLSTYGKTKLAGESAVRSVGGRALILRTAWVYSDRKKNFFLTIRRLATERPELRVVDDQFGTPTWTRPLAQAVVRIWGSLAEQGARQTPDAGAIYHATCAGQTTWHDFAREILSEMKTAGSASPPLAKLQRISSAEYAAAAKRPRNSVLSNAKLKRDFGIEMPDWRQALAECSRLVAARAQT